MVFGRRGTYAAFAVLVTLLIAATALLAAPAWSDTRNKDSGYPKEATTKKGSSQVESKPSGSKLSGKETTQRGTSQAKSKASTKDPGRPGVTTPEEGTSQTKSKTSEKSEPPAGNKVEVRDNDPKGEVNAGDILLVSGDYEGISSDGSVTVKDGDGDQATFDRRNAKLTVMDNGNLKVEVKKDLNFRDGRRMSVKNLKAIKLAGVHHHRHRHHGGKNGGSKNSVNNSNDARDNLVTINDATDGDTTADDNGITEDTTTDDTTDNTTTDTTTDDNTTDTTTDDNTTDNGTTNNNGIGNSAGPGCAIASAGGTTAIAGCGSDNTTAGDQYNSDTGTTINPSDQNNSNTGTDTNASDQNNDNTGTNSNMDDQNDGNSGTDITSTDTQNDGSTGTDTTGDPLSDGSESLYSLDDQDPIDEPPGDVIDEIDTGSDLLPETGGLPDIREPRDTGELPETRGVPVAALTPPLGVAFVVMVLAVWRFGARRG